MLQLTVPAAYFSDMLVKLKRGCILKQHRGYIDDGEFEGEMAAVELALKALEVPEGRPMICKTPSVTGRHVRPLFLSNHW